MIEMGYVIHIIFNTIILGQIIWCNLFYTLNEVYIVYYGKCNIIDIEIKKPKSLVKLMKYIHKEYKIIIIKTNKKKTQDTEIEQDECYWY